MGAWASWGLSTLQLLIGLGIVGAALREGVPGRELSRTALVGSLGLAVALLAGITLATQRLAPTVVPSGVWQRFAWECFGMAALAGVPGLAVTAALAARLLPGRPAVAGALHGLGVGLMADAGFRLFCWVSTPSHVLVSHGAAILVLAAGGAAVSTILDRVKA
jgi:hypothetical protein